MSWLPAMVSTAFHISLDISVNLLFFKGMSLGNFVIICYSMMWGMY